MMPCVAYVISETTKFKHTQTLPLLTSFIVKEEMLPIVILPQTVYSITLFLTNLIGKQCFCPVVAMRLPVNYFDMEDGLGAF